MLNVFTKNRFWKNTKINFKIIKPEDQNKKNSCGHHSFNEQCITICTLLHILWNLYTLLFSAAGRIILQSEVQLSNNTLVQIFDFVWRKELLLKLLCMKSSWQCRKAKKKNGDEMVIKFMHLKIKEKIKSRKWSLMISNELL